MRSAVGAFCTGPRRVARVFRFYLFFDVEVTGFEEELDAVLDCGSRRGLAVPGGARKPAGRSDGRGAWSAPRVSLPVAWAGEKAADASPEAKTRDAAIGSHLIAFPVSVDAG